MPTAANYPSPTSYGKTGYHEFADKIRGIIQTTIVDASTGVDLDASTAAKLDAANITGNFVLFLSDVEQIFVATRPLGSVTCTFASGGRQFGNPATPKQDHVALIAKFELVAGATQMARVVAEQKALIDDMVNFLRNDEPASVIDAFFAIADQADPTKKLAFDVTGTTAVTGTIQTAFTTAKTVLVPDIAGTFAMLQSGIPTGDAAAFPTASFLNKTLALVADNGGNNDLKALIAIKATNIYDRPSIAWWDSVGQLRAFIAYHGTNFSNAALHNQWEVKTWDGSSGFLTRIGVGSGSTDTTLQYTGITEHVTRIRAGFEISYHAIVERPNGTDNQLGRIKFEWNNDTDRDSYIRIDPLTIDDTRDAIVRIFRETNTAATRAVEIYSGNGTGSNVVFLLDVGSGNFSFKSGTSFYGTFNHANTTSNKAYFFPNANITVAGLEIDQTFSGVQTLAGTLIIKAGTNFTGTFTHANGTNRTWTSQDIDGTIALLENNLGAFSATTSTQLRNAITDETGTGSLVFATSPTLATPVLGVATATSINKVAFTAPASSATLTIADGKTLTWSNSITVTGTDATSFAFPATSDAVAVLGIAQTFTRGQTINPVTMPGLTLAHTTTPVGSASVFASLISVASSTVAFATSAQTGNYYGVELNPATLTGASAGTIPQAATLHVSGPPVASTNVTITTAYVQWNQNGLSRFDTQVSINGSSVSGARLTVNHASGGTGTASAYRGLLFSQAATIAYTTTAQTGEYSGVDLGVVTISQPSAATLGLASTLKIVGAPLAGTNCTITTARALWVVAGLTQLDGGLTTSGGLVTMAPATTPTGSASAYTALLSVPSGTITYQTTPQTGDFSGMSFGVATIAQPSAGTITNAATMKITGAPLAGTNTTLTNSYSIWVSAGVMRIDPAILVNTVSDTTNAQVVITPTTSIVGSSSLTHAGIRILASTVAFTGATAQTGDVNVTFHGISTLTNATAGTVANASTFKVAGAPIAGSGMTITNAYAVWIAGGTTRIDGSILINPNTAPVGSASQYNDFANFAAATITFNANQTGDYVGHRYGQTTLAQTSAATIPNASTLKIDGAPIAGTNATLTVSRALWVASGRSQFDGAMRLGGATSDTIGFYGNAGIAQATGTNAILTDSSGGTASTTIANAGVVYDQTNQNAFRASVTRAIQVLANALRTTTGVALISG